MAQNLFHQAVFIVTGSGLVAEQRDRPLAYFLKSQIDRYGGPDRLRCGVVVSDRWYLATPAVHDYPTISVGGPGVNLLSRKLGDELPTAMSVENVFVIQMDLTFEDLRVSVWGTDHETTREAVQTLYEKGYLRRYLEAIWGEPVERFEDDSDESIL